ncbi:DNA-binding Xre family transcriptional regulator [Thermomonospora umbrina]|uniref:DNA-binding Xre family transcriptional regulator n=1 Tax=Thermomonospora umbrina TaxID=111806 RepID=A0A3D9T5M3_9ACTN|nr:DNA-binding Xre family transcriptional regulator [Thermomonospora umbrina]
MGAGQRPGRGPARREGKVREVRWNLRLKAAERGIWKSTEMRRLLADAGLEISAGKMSALWTGTPTTIRLDDLDVICFVLDCEPTELLIREPEQVEARRPRKVQEATAGPPVTPRLGRSKSLPPA